MNRLCVVLISISCLMCGGTSLAHAASAAWVQLSPAHSPSGRYWPSMAYDPVSHQTLLFGGMSSTGLTNDTWMFDGTDWTQVQTPTAPLPRYGAAMAFDRVAQRIVLYGGVQSIHSFFSDTWLWDGATRTWTQAAPSHSPPAMVGAMAFTDPNGGHVSMFGGQDANGADYDITYRWTGSDWRKLNLNQHPEARAFGTLALDHGSRIVVLFGGESRLDVNNTWTWDGRAWTKQSPANQPPFTFFSAGAYDSALKSVVLFGGMANGFNHNITWAWDGTNWQDLAPAQAPAARSKMGMAYDNSVDHPILFGGTSGIGQFFNDTWELQP